MGPTNSLSYLVEHLSANIGKLTDQVLQEHVGISFSQYKILMVLEWNPRVQQKSIAISLGQTEASVSRQVKLLVRKGLLESKPDPNNRRKHISTPTPRGMQFTESAANMLRHSFGPAFKSMGEAQLTQLLNSLQQLHAIICRPGMPGACDHPLGL